MKLFGNLTIGADPELFLRNPNSGEFFSAHQFVKGNKENPHLVDKGAVQLDGTAAEFNIDPVTNANDFVGNIATVMTQLADMTRGSGYVLSASPVADYDPTYWKEHVPATCKVLGCDPDYNAWELCPNPTPEGDRAFRTGSGHVHIGWGTGFDCFDPDHFQKCAEVARQLDYHLGIHSLLWDGENRRRELYGKAGAFRPKPYGLEYRVLSNAWLKSEMLQRWVFAATVAAMQDLDNGIKYEVEHKDFARHVIDNNNTKWYDDPKAPKFSSVPMPPGFKKVA